MNAMPLLVLIVALAGSFGLCCTVLANTEEGRPLDLAAFGQWIVWSGDTLDEAVPVKALTDVPDDVHTVGVQWNYPRDVREIVAVFAGDAPEGVAVEYWFRTWPPPPPQMPTMEDEIDDPWQGQWLQAKTSVQRRGDRCVFSFEPLGEENPHFQNLPGVTYRRTLKLRLILPADAPRLEALVVHSDSVVQRRSVRIQLACDREDETAWSGGIEIFNGTLESVTPWRFDEGDRFVVPASWENVRIGDKPKGVVVHLLESRSQLRGSNDITIVTVQGTMKTGNQEVSRTFSFSTRDLDDGPIHVPDINVYVTESDDPKPFDPTIDPQVTKIRDLIPLEPEQSYERASREIPPQDPWVRQYGDMVYLVAAADASWQKFAVRYDGNIFISRWQTKAFGAEGKRLKWPGSKIHFWIGTGAEPYFGEDHQGSMAVAEEYLPIMINRWERDGLQYEQESFATLLEGPLDPNDPARCEQTPAVLMVRLQAKNPGNRSKTAHFWFQITPDDPIEIDGKRIIAKPQWNEFSPESILRAVIEPPDGASLELGRNEFRGFGTDDRWVRTTPEADRAVTCQYEVPAGATRTVYLALPFVSDVDDAGAEKLEALDYDTERERIADYWRTLTLLTTRFTTPEPKFNSMARFVIPHIHISTTKDPKSGLFMVPAASYLYSVYANEACFQAMLLDILGDSKRARQCLETFVTLQGSRMFRGMYTPPHDGVYHGVKVREDYDYTVSSYNLDHGTVLWSLARHYLYTRDKVWLEETLPSMLKAVEWIMRQRQATMHHDLHGRRPIEYGLLPAGHLEDNSDWGYWFATNAYCVAGMTRMAEAMADIGHPHAGTIAHQAQAYRDDLRLAVIRTAERAPVVKMRDGT